MSCQNHNYQTDYYEYKLTALIDNEPYFANLIDQIGCREANLHKLSLPIDLVLIIIVHLEHVAIIGVGLVG
jgi:hypothetical protein